MIERGPFKTKLDHYKFLSQIASLSFIYGMRIEIYYN